MERNNPVPISYDSCSHYITGKYVGAFVSEEVAGRLRLLALIRETTVQGVIQEAIGNMTIPPEGAWIEGIADIALREWWRRKEQIHRYRRKKEWGKFLDEVKRNLKKRKVFQTHIKQIVAEIKRQEHEAKQDQQQAKPGQSGEAEQ